ncbi:hypothetical protein CLAIMM_03483 [Cladophialophora immunda]|nr:hypothetical protein CLAIMM_03483 [Cladophialophora immunda]
MSTPSDMPAAAATQPLQKSNADTSQDPAKTVRLSTRVILNGHRATDLFSIPAAKGRSMAQVLEWLNRHMYAFHQRLWSQIGSLLFVEENPGFFVLQQLVKRKKNPRKFSQISYNNTRGYFNWFKEHILSGHCANSEIKMEVHVSNYHQRELVELGEPGPRKKPLKQRWTVRRYVRFEAEFEEEELEAQKEKDRKLREIGLLPSMDESQEAKHYKPKQPPYAISTVGNFGPESATYMAEWDYEEDTDDEYYGRGEELGDW